MSNFVGFVSAGLQMGLQSLLIKPQRGIYDVTNPDNSTSPDILANAVIKEIHHDELEVTEHPVEIGAMIADHAFKRPSEVIIEMAWSNSPNQAGGLIDAAVAAAASVSPLVNSISNAASLAQGASSILFPSTNSNLKDIYAALIQLQSNRSLFTVYTGKKIYSNMVCKSLVVETDMKTENALFATMTCREVLLVSTQTAALPAPVQADPLKTASFVNSGFQSLKSALGYSVMQ